MEKILILEIYSIIVIIIVVIKKRNNEFKQFIQKNQFDKELLRTIKKKGSFH